MRSNITSPEIWDQLKQLIPTWCRRKEIICHWAAVSRNINSSIQSIVLKQNLNINTEQLTITDDGYEGNSYTVRLLATKPFILYSWHRMLRKFSSIDSIDLFGDPCKLDSYHFTKFSKVLLESATARLGNGAAVGKKSITHVLRLFGSWLFEASLKSEHG